MSLLAPTAGERTKSHSRKNTKCQNLSCPSCDHRWQMAFDILYFFWSEINAWASRIMQEVHVLARAYGWRENEILGMSPWRRQRYLKMLGK